MIKLILIIAYVIAFGATAVLFFFYGRKNGWRGGAAVMTAAAAAFIVSYFLAPAAASVIVGIQPVGQLIENAANVAAGSGLDSEALAAVLSDAAQRVLEIPLAIVLYIVAFIILFAVAGTVMKSIKPKNAVTESKSKLIGSVLGTAAPVLVAVLTLFVSRVNLFNESDAVDSILDLTSKSENEIIAEILNDPDSYTKILFETTLTGFDENQRLELINKSVKGIVSNTDDRLLIECFDFAGYSTRSEFETDVRTVTALYNAFDGIDLFSEEDLAKKVFAVTDKSAMAENLYSLSFKDGIIRYVISYAVQDLTDNEDFVYPKDSMIQGTCEDFVQLISAAEKYEKGEASQLDLITELSGSPLVPAELFEGLSQVVFEELHDEIFDRLNEELSEEELDEERFEELYEELYDEFGEELNEGLNEDRINELYEELYDRLNGAVEP